MTIRFDASGKWMSKSERIAQDADNTKARLVESASGITVLDTERPRYSKWLGQACLATKTITLDIPDIARYAKDWAKRLVMREPEPSEDDYIEYTIAALNDVFIHELIHIQGEIHHRGTSLHKGYANRKFAKILQLMGQPFAFQTYAHWGRPDFHQKLEKQVVELE